MAIEEATLEKVSKAILDKARAEAESILEKARKEAEKTIEKAKLKRKEKYEKEVAKIISEAKREARSIIVKATLKNRREIAEAKHKVIKEVIEEAKRKLRLRKFDVKKSLTALLLESLASIPAEKIIVYVNPRDVNLLTEIVKEQKLEDKVEKIVADKSLSGGLIVSSPDGKFKVNNTYEARLEMVMTKLLPELSKELFGE